MDHDGGFFLPDEPPAEPEFAEMEANVTGQLDGTVFLHCPVISSAGDRAISYPSVSPSIPLQGHDPITPSILFFLPPMRHFFRTKTKIEGAKKSGRDQREQMKKKVSSFLPCSHFTCGASYSWLLCFAPLCELAIGTKASL